MASQVRSGAFLAGRDLPRTQPIPNCKTTTINSKSGAKCRAEAGGARGRDAVTKRSLSVGLKNIYILTTSPPDSGLLRPRARQQARRSGGGGGNVRRAQLRASAQVPTPPPGEGRPDSARPPGPGRETSRQSRGVQEATDSPEAPVPSSPPCSRIQSSARPPNRPSPGSAPAPTPPARPVASGRPAARRPLGGRPRLTSSRLRGQGRTNSAGLPRLTRRPALCGRARPVHSAAARALGGRREQGGGSGEGGERRTARQEEAREGAGRGGGGSGARASGPLGAACALLSAEAPSLPSGAARTRVHVPAWRWLGWETGGWGPGSEDRAELGLSEWGPREGWLTVAVPQNLPEG